MQRGIATEPNRLLLYPQEPSFASATQAELIQTLQTAGFMGDQWKEDRYLIGEHFLSAIGFLGCSPSLRMEPLDDPMDLRFCHWQIPTVTDSPQLTASRTIKPPLCPECRTAFNHWRDSESPNAAISCPQCGLSSPTEAWIWRRKAMCFSRTQIAICNVFEGEAVPDPSLLSLLKEVSGIDWLYCYITP